MDESAEYEPLFAVNTYDRNGSPNVSGKPAAINIEVYAKSENHTIVKEQGDDFAQIGQDVNYTIKATFPMSENTAGQRLENFIITDTPTGVAIDEESVKVTLGETSNDITNDIHVSVDAETGVLTVNFANILSGGHDGKDIVITYTATVTDTAYNNKVTAASTTTNYKLDETSGKNGSIQITKVDAEDKNEVKTPLAGAEFQVYDLGSGEWDDENPGTPMNFVYDAEEQAYRPALKTDEKDSITDTIVATNGVVRVIGLDEGNYHFDETRAPSGYAINDLGETYTVANEEGKIDLSEYFEDTKMAALPETGGMGTTLFTIAGCVIMISAAGLFFATRKKAN